MYKGKHIIAIIPARGGSKGLPLKNLVNFKGKSLIQRVSEVVSKVQEIDTAIISTDHQGIANEGKKYGLDVPFIRPEDLSGDLVGDVDVLTHALLQSEDIYGLEYDLVLMLQPTSPNRTTHHIYQALDKMIDGDYDSVWTISKTDKKYHPLKQIELIDGMLKLYDRRGSDIIARQQLSQLYYRNGVAYLMNRDVLIKKQSLIGDKPGVVILEGYIANIDTKKDIENAELLS